VLRTSLLEACRGYRCGHTSRRRDVAVAVVATKIQRHQAAVAQAKLKLDLFEKRYAIFLETWQIMSEVGTNGTRGENAKRYGFGTPFSNFTPQAGFLFGKEVQAYLSDAVDKWIELHGLEGEREDAAARAQHAARVRELKEWFFNQAKTGLKDLLGPYLDFGEWR
jgi:hypothetical protein